MGLAVRPGPPCQNCREGQELMNDVRWYDEDASRVSGTIYVKKEMGNEDV